MLLMMDVVPRAELLALSIIVPRKNVIYFNLPNMIQRQAANKLNFGSCAFQQV